jgi:putative transcriptional regulator
LTIHAHPDDAMLARWASGALRPGFDLVVGAHLEACSACRAKVRGFEAAAGELLTEVPETALADDALARALARLEREPKPFAANAEPAAGKLLDRLPRKSTRWLAPGTWVQPIDVDHLPGDRVYLLRVAGGLTGLDHGHTGIECTTVLSGALQDGDEVLRAGDFSAHGPELRHRPKALKEDGGCLCLIATEGGVRVGDWLGRMIAAWTGV